MSKQKNQRIWSNDAELLQRIADEQENYIGRPYKLDLKQGLLIIYALPRRRVKQQRNDDKKKHEHVDK